MQAARFCIFDPKVDNVLALLELARAIFGGSMAEAMNGELWNPWAVGMSYRQHPLPAKRIKALEKQCEALAERHRSPFARCERKSYWDEFLVDLAVNQLAWIAL